MFPVIMQHFTKEEIKNLLRFFQKTISFLTKNTDCTKKKKKEYKTKFMAFIENFSSLRLTVTSNASHLVQ